MNADKRRLKPSRRTLSRRSFGRLLAAPVAVAAGASPQAASPDEELRAANQRRLSNAENLAKFDLPMDTEPAFVFRA